MLQVTTELLYSWITYQIPLWFPHVLFNLNTVSLNYSDKENKEQKVNSEQKLKRRREQEKQKYREDADVQNEKHQKG